MSSRLTETAMLAEAVVQAQATEDLGIKYCEELIIAAHNAVRAWYSSEYMTRKRRRRLELAIFELENLVGRP